ncbi:MAG: hypothetical protein LBV34_11440 [Nocardiopsaceae bacterium]|nr:hypothetical protein [Nocardiopsaceae bacterium]
MNSPQRSFATDWTRLWQLAERVAVTRHEQPDYVFLPIGLRLGDPVRAHAWDYSATPVNVTTFASTGGDGVHFSVINASGQSGPTPIVMTVPMAFNDPNHIVGADLRDFLALGCRTGYSCLEDLAYRALRDEVIERLRSARLPDDPEQTILLRSLSAEFGLGRRSFRGIGVTGRTIVSKTFTPMFRKTLRDNARDASGWGMSARDQAWRNVERRLKELETSYGASLQHRSRPGAE